MFLLPCSAVQRAHIHSEGVGVGILNLKESEAKKTTIAIITIENSNL